jgi:hypothetical protein
MIVDNESVTVPSDYRFSSLFSFTFAREGSLQLTLRATLPRPVYFMLCSDAQLGPLRNSDITFSELCMNPKLHLPDCTHLGEFGPPQQLSTGRILTLFPTNAAATAAAATTAPGAESGGGIAYRSAAHPRTFAPLVLLADGSVAPAALVDDSDSSAAARKEAYRRARDAFTYTDTSTDAATGAEAAAGAVEASYLLAARTRPPASHGSPGASLAGAAVAEVTAADESVVSVDIPAIPTQDRYRFLQLNCKEIEWSGKLSYVAMNPGGEHLSLTLVPYKTLYHVLVFVFMATLLTWLLHWVRYWRWAILPQLALTALPAAKMVQCFSLLLYWRTCSITGRMPTALYVFSFGVSMITRTLLFLLFFVLACGWGMFTSRVPRPLLLRILAIVAINTVGLAMYHLGMGMAVIIVLLNYAILWQAFGLICFISRRLIDTQAQLLLSVDIAPSKTPLADKSRALTLLHSTVGLFILADLTIHLWSSVFAATAPWAEDTLENVSVWALWSLIAWGGYRMRPFNPHLNALARAHSQTLAAADMVAVNAALRPRITPPVPAAAAAGADAEAPRADVDSSGGIADECLWYPTLSLDNLFATLRKRSAVSADRSSSSGGAHPSLAARERQRQQRDQEFMRALQAQAQAQAQLPGSSSSSSSYGYGSHAGGSSSGHGNGAGSPFLSPSGGGGAASPLSLQLSPSAVGGASSMVGLTAASAAAASAAAAGVPFPLAKEMYMLLHKEDPSMRQLVALAHEPCACFQPASSSSSSTSGVYFAGGDGVPRGTRRRAAGADAPERPDFCPHVHMALLFSHTKPGKTAGSATTTAVAAAVGSGSRGGSSGSGSGPDGYGGYQQGGPSAPAAAAGPGGLRGLLPGQRSRYRQLDEEDGE